MSGNDNAPIDGSNDEGRRSENGTRRAIVDRRVISHGPWRERSPRRPRNLSRTSAKRTVLSCCVEGGKRPCAPERIPTRVTRTARKRGVRADARHAPACARARGDLLCLSWNSQNRNTRREKYNLVIGVLSENILAHSFAATSKRNALDQVRKKR